MTPSCIFCPMMPRRFQKSIWYDTIRTETYKCELMAPKSFKRLTVDLPEDLFIRLKSLCVHKNLSMRVAVTRLIYHEIRFQEQLEEKDARTVSENAVQEP